MTVPVPVPAGAGANKGERMSENVTGLGCVLYAKCWACQFDSHYDEPTPHTWMDEDDAQHAGVEYVPAELTVSHPCPCYCGRVSLQERTDQ